MSTKKLESKRVDSMVVPVSIELKGNFIDMYNLAKPYSMSHDSFITAIVQAWLLNLEESRTKRGKGN